MGYSSLLVYIVMPDLSLSKLKAIELASREARFGILVSYSTIKMKPVTLERLRELRRLADTPVMLDSGAYHLRRLGVSIGVEEYAGFASSHGGLFDEIVAPDVPGDCSETVERTRAFSKTYGGEFVPVAQGSSLEDYIACAEMLKEHARELLGVGGLDGERRRAGFVKRLVAELPPTLHLFGAGARLVYSIAASGLIDKVRSVDSMGWLAEIKYRRRTKLKADGTVEANARAIIEYVRRVEKAADRGYESREAG